jgi:hypothetical protein
MMLTLSSMAATLMLATARHSSTADHSSSVVTFEKPVRLGPTDGMSDDFYAVGPLGSRVVFGMRTQPHGDPQTSEYPTTEATMSSSDGRSWEPMPHSCAGVVARGARQTSNTHACMRVSQPKPESSFASQTGDIRWQRTTLSAPTPTGACARP